MRSLVCACMFLAIALATGTYCYAQTNGLTGLLKNVTGSVLDGAASAVDEVNGAATTLLDEVNNVLDTTLEQTGLEAVTFPLLGNTVETTLDAVTETVNDTTDTIHQTLDLTDNIVDTAVNTLDEPLNQVSDIAGSLIKQVGEWTGLGPRQEELIEPTVPISNPPEIPESPELPAPSEPPVQPELPAPSSEPETNHATPAEPVPVISGKKDGAKSTDAPPTASEAPVASDDQSFLPETSDRKDAPKIAAIERTAPIPSTAGASKTVRNRVSGCDDSSVAHKMPCSPQTAATAGSTADTRQAPDSTAHHYRITVAFIGAGAGTAHSESGTGLSGGQASPFSVISAQNHDVDPSVEFIRPDIKLLSSQWNHAPPGKPPKSPFSVHTFVI